jgi:Flp pilus assembly protein TadG
MLTRGSPSPLRFLKDQQGAYAVEFAILMPVLLLLLFGIVDFGHCISMKQIMVNAAREGARYGTVYQTDASGNRLLLNNLNPSIENYIINTSAENGGKGGVGLQSLLAADANPVITKGGSACTESNPLSLAGEDLTITITAEKKWLVIGNLIPGLGNSITLTSTTNMRCE